MDTTGSDPERRLTQRVRLLPEEDAIGEPDDQDDDRDDTLPADLWYRAGSCP
jgi:hypothetical protein